jgi:hypothetical protein
MPRNMAARIFPTSHARTTMRKRSITWAEIVAVVSKPERVYDSRGSRMYQGSAITVAVAPDGAVVTVLLTRNPETIERNRWTDDDARGREA